MKTIISESTRKYACYENGAWHTTDIPTLYPDAVTFDALLNEWQETGTGYIMVNVEVREIIPPSQIREIQLETIKEKYRDYLTVGRLKEKLSEYPDDAKVLVQRIEDAYYEKHHWGVVKKKGEYYFSVVKMNTEMHEEISRRERGEERDYAMEDPNQYITSEEELLNYLEQYHPVWCVAGFRDDPNNLYLSLHY